MNTPANQKNGSRHGESGSGTAAVSVVSENIRGSQPGSTTSKFANGTAKPARCLNTTRKKFSAFSDAKAQSACRFTEARAGQRARSVAGATFASNASDKPSNNAAANRCNLR